MRLLAASVLCALTSTYAHNTSISNYIESGVHSYSPDASHATNYTTALLQSTSTAGDIQALYGGLHLSNALESPSIQTMTLQYTVDNVYPLLNITHSFAGQDQSQWMAIPIDLSLVKPESQSLTYNLYLELDDHSTFSTAVESVLLNPLRAKPPTLQAPQQLQAIEKGQVNGVDFQTVANSTTIQLTTASPSSFGYVILHVIIDGQITQNLQQPVTAGQTTMTWQLVAPITNTLICTYTFGTSDGVQYNTPIWSYSVDQLTGSVPASATLAPVIDHVATAPPTTQTTVTPSHVAATVPATTQQTTAAVSSRLAATATSAAATTPTSTPASTASATVTATQAATTSAAPTPAPTQAQTAPPTSASTPAPTSASTSAPTSASTTAKQAVASPAASNTNGAAGHTLTFVNQCHYDVWPAGAPGDGNSPIPEAGFHLAPGASHSVHLNTKWTGRWWGRTGCKFDGNGAGHCESGDCGNGIACGLWGKLPATLAEFSFGDNYDWYDISLVDGFNIPMQIIPVGGSGSNCVNSIVATNMNAICPAELAVWDSAHQNVVGCNSACNAFGTAEYCCTGAHATSNTCGPSSYSKWYRQISDTSYSYAYDDSATYFCVTDNWKVTFCPSGQQNNLLYNGQPAANPTTIY